MISSAIRKRRNLRIDNLVCTATPISPPNPLLLNALMRKLLAVLGILILSVIMLIFGAFGTAALLGIPLFIFYAIWGQTPRPTSN